MDYTLTEDGRWVVNLYKRQGSFGERRADSVIVGDEVAAALDCARLTQGAPEVNVRGVSGRTLGGNGLHWTGAED